VFIFSLTLFAFRSSLWAGSTLCVSTAGVEKTEIEEDYIYVKLNPLKTMTAELFEDAIAERQAVLEAKDKFRSQYASL